MAETSFPRDRIRITLLENAHPAAAEALRERGYTVEVIPRALEGDELCEVMAASHVLGVRSRTKVREAHLEHAGRMLAIGCFSVGTDQVAIADAARRGIPVFNAPYASTRSVAELTMGCVIALARRLGDKSGALHRHHWDKSLAGAHEVRGRTIGLIGYGHIGQQVGLLAEAFGMRVLFHDILKKLPLGLARPIPELDRLLEEADFVSLHVPETPRTVGLIGSAQLECMRPGSYLLNLSRGKVVDVAALREALAGGHLAGAALEPPAGFVPPPGPPARRVPAPPFRWGSVVPLALEPPRAPHRWPHPLGDGPAAPRPAPPPAPSAPSSPPRPAPLPPRVDREGHLSAIEAATVAQLGPVRGCAPLAPPALNVSPEAAGAWRAAYRRRLAAGFDIETAERLTNTTHGPRSA